jgi:hypothetical protein
MTAEDRFRQVLDWAHQQGALRWELRAGTSLARPLRDQRRSADAMALLVGGSRFGQPQDLKPCCLTCSRQRMIRGCA